MLGFCCAFTLIDQESRTNKNSFFINDFEKNQQCGLTLQDFMTANLQDLLLPFDTLLLNLPLIQSFFRFKNPRTRV